MELRIDIGAAERPIRIGREIILKARVGLAEPRMGQNLCLQRCVKLMLKRPLDFAHPVGLVCIEGVDGAAIFAAHLVRRRTGMRPQMDFDQRIERDDVRNERNLDRFRPPVMRWRRSDEPLSDIMNAAQRLEHRFGAPVTAAAETDPLFR